MKILQLKTGLFPDASRVKQALETQREDYKIGETDISGLLPDDDGDWSKVVSSILSADRIVTL